MKQMDNRIATEIASAVFVLLTTASLFATRGQDLTAQQRADLCASKQTTLSRIEADADLKRKQVNEEIFDAEKFAENARNQRARLLNAPGHEAIAELNKALQTISYNIRLSENDARNAPSQRYRDRAKAELESQYSYRDFLTGLRAAIESSGLMPAGSADDDSFIKAADRKVRELKNRRDQIGSDINILQQSIESLGCAGLDRTGVTKIVVCHDYTLYRVTCTTGRCEDINDTSASKLRERLAALGYKRFPLTNTAGNDPDLAELVLKPGDVLFLRDAHSGYVNENYKIDHYLQLLGEIGRPRNPDNLPLFTGARDQPGGHFRDDSLAQFLDRPLLKVPIGSLEVWRHKVVPAPAAPKQTIANFAGDWDTGLGIYNVPAAMTLTQTGNKVDGTYTHKGGTGTIDGKVVGSRTLTFEWTEGSRKGTGVFTGVFDILTVDIQSFTGSWSEGGVYAGDWRGRLRKRGEPNVKVGDGAAGPIAAAVPTGRSRVEILDVVGEVEISPGGDDSQAYKVTAGTVVRKGDRIVTGMDSHVRLRLPDGSIIEVSELTYAKVDSLTPMDARTQLWLKAGEVSAEINTRQGVQSDFSIKTPATSLGSRGTKFTVRHNDQTGVTTIRVTEGAVEVTPENSSLQSFILRAIQQVDIASNKVSPITDISTTTAKNGPRPGNAESAGGNFTRRDNTTISPPAKILRYFGCPSEDACKTSCAGDQGCVAYTFVRPGGYQAGDPPMCYLMSSLGPQVEHSCCVSGLKGGGTGERPAGSDTVTNRVTSEEAKAGETAPSTIKIPDQVSRTESAPSRTAADESKTVEVTVRADATNNGWTSSGLSVQPGQRLRITARGRIDLGGGRSAPPEGLPSLADRDRLMLDRPTGGLIAVIGDDNDDFIYIGQDAEFVVRRSGVLFLGVNEGNLKDNTGGFNVTIRIETRIVTN